MCRAKQRHHQVEPVGEHLDDGVQVCQLAEVSVRELARLHPRGASQQLQAVQLSQYLLLHLWVLRDEVPTYSNGQNAK